MHDATRVASLLREVFVGDRSRVGMLLGAGCPVSIRVSDGVGGQTSLIPDVSGLTSHVFDFLRQNHADLAQKLDGDLKAEGLQGANIEKVLSRVRLIEEIAGNANFRDFGPGDVKAINDIICNTISGRVNRELPGEANGYRNLASWIRGASREFPVELFTTNYDLLLEQALEEARISTFDGFTGSRRPFFDVAAIENNDTIPAKWTRVWKLHGSVNWEETSSAVHRVSGGAVTCALIHPSHRKYDQSRRLPYLALMDRLRAFLRQASSALVVCGYSFGDEHLNEIIVEGLEQNPTAAVFALQFGSLRKYASGVELAGSLPGLSIYAEDKGVIGTRPGPWVVPADADTSLLRGTFASVGVDTEGWEGGSWRFLNGNFGQFGPFLLEMTGTQVVA